MLAILRQPVEESTVDLGSHAPAARLRIPRQLGEGLEALRQVGAARDQRVRRDADGGDTRAARLLRPGDDVAGEIAPRRLIVVAVVADGTVAPRVEAGEERRHGWQRPRRLRDGLREDEAARRERIEVGAGARIGPVAAEAVGAQRVDEQDDDVGLLGARSLARPPCLLHEPDLAPGRSPGERTGRPLGLGREDDLRLPSGGRAEIDTLVEPASILPGARGIDGARPDARGHRPTARSARRSAAGRAGRRPVRRRRRRARRPGARRARSAPVPAVARSRLGRSPCPARRLPGLISPMRTGSVALASTVAPARLRVRSATGSSMTITGGRAPSRRRVIIHQPVPAMARTAAAATRRRAVRSVASGGHAVACGAHDIVRSPTRATSHVRAHVPHGKRGAAWGSNGSTRWCSAGGRERASGPCPARCIRSSSSRSRPSAPCCRTRSSAPWMPSASRRPSSWATRSTASSWRSSSGSSACRPTR